MILLLFLMYLGSNGVLLTEEQCRKYRRCFASIVKFRIIEFGLKNPLDACLMCRTIALIQVSMAPFTRSECTASDLDIYGFPSKVAQRS